MKRILLAFIVVILGVVEKSQAQTNKYHPFPDSNAVWSNYQVYFFCPGFCQVESCTSNYQYRMKGDTIISGIMYHKIYKQGMWSYGQIDSISSVGYYFTSCLPPVYSSTYFGGIRNDTLHKKVFFNQGLSSGETLLYDFSIAVGDTSVGGVLTSIDSVLVNGNYRKRFNYNYNDDLSTVEGIGNVSISGSQNNVELFLVGIAEYTSWSFICFWQNDNFMYGDSTCSEISAIKNITQKTDNILIYPNPASSSIQVSLTGNSAIKEITLVDVLGNEVPIPNPFQRKGNSTTIDVSTLANGVYFINLKTSEGVVTKKLVVQH